MDLEVSYFQTKPRDERYGGDVEWNIIKNILEYNGYVFGAELKLNIVRGISREI